jgi:hypothetical protein
MLSDGMARFLEVLRPFDGGGGQSRNRFPNAMARKRPILTFT